MFHKPIEYEKYKPKTKQMIKEIFSNTTVDTHMDSWYIIHVCFPLKKQV